VFLTAKCQNTCEIQDVVKYAVHLPVPAQHGQHTRAHGADSWFGVGVLKSARDKRVIESISLHARLCTANMSIATATADRL